MISFSLCPALTIIVGELYCLACWWLWLYWWFHVHSSCCIGNHSMWVLYSCILVTVIILMITCSFLSCSGNYREWVVHSCMLKICWWFYVHSSSYSGNHSLWVVHSGMLITVILFMIPYPYHSSFYSGNHSLWVLYLIYPWLWWCWWYYIHSLYCFGNHSG